MQLLANIARQIIGAALANMVYTLRVTLSMKIAVKGNEIVK